MPALDDVFRGGRSVPRLCMRCGLKPKAANVRLQVQSLTDTRNRSKGGGFCADCAAEVFNLCMEILVGKGK